MPTESRPNLCMGQPGISKLLESPLEPLARRIDAPEPKPADPLQDIKKYCRCHDEIDPIRRRHKVDQPREIQIRELGLTFDKVLARFGGERQRSGGVDVFWRIGLDETRQLCAEQHQHSYALGAASA